MKQNAKDYTVGERQFILYQYLRKNTRKDKVATKQMIKDHLLLTYDIEITDNTLYHDIAVLCGDAMGLQASYPTKQKENGYPFGGYFINADWVREATKKALCREPKAA